MAVRLGSVFAGLAPFQCRSQLCFGGGAAEPQPREHFRGRSGHRRERAWAGSTAKMTPCSTQERPTRPPEHWPGGGEEAIGITARRLHKRLRERGIHRTTDEIRGRLRIRPTLNGRRQEVLHVSGEFLGGALRTEPAQSAQPGLAVTGATMCVPRGPMSWAGLPTDETDAGAGRPTIDQALKRVMARWASWAGIPPRRFQGAGRARRRIRPFRLSGTRPARTSPRNRPMTGGIRGPILRPIPVLTDGRSRDVDASNLIFAILLRGVAIECGCGRLLVRPRRRLPGSPSGPAPRPQGGGGAVSQGPAWLR